MLHTRLILGVLLLAPVLCTEPAAAFGWSSLRHQEKEGCGSAAFSMVLQY